MGGIVATNVTATGVNTATIGTVIATIGIPSVLCTPSTGLYAGIDSLFGSGNVAIYGAGLSEYINVV